MSKRHQASRRKAYGRRQHEIRERRDQHLTNDGFDVELDDVGPASLPDRFAFFDPRAPRLRFVLGD